MVNNSELSKHDLNEIAEIETAMSESLNRIKKSQSFNLGDYLISMIQVYYGSEKRVVERNFYGAPIKYKVVHIDSNNISYVKQLNANGKTFGSVICVHDVGSDTSFELDPEYVDAVIMQSESNFDPTETHKILMSTRKEIVKHNKEAKLKIDTCAQAVALTRCFQVGEVYWISANKFFKVLNIQIKPTPTGIWETKKVESMWGHKIGVRYPRKVEFISVIEVEYNNGTKETIKPHSLVHTNLYKKQPLKFKKSSDTI